MSKKYNKTLIKAAILTMSFVQMGTNGISPILADIARTFPNASTSKVQFLMTFPCFFVIFISLISAFLTKHFSKKVLCSIGLIMISLSGLSAFVIHSSLTMLFFHAAIMGIGIGLVSPIAASMISDFFDGSNRNKLMGIQNSAANIGSMIMTFAGGFLATFGWQYNYLVYVIAIPGLLFCIFAIPGYDPRNKSDNITAKDSDSAIKVPLSILFYCVIAFCLLILFNMGPTNLSLLITELKIGNSTVSGTAASFFLLGGTVMGIFFGKISDKIGDYSIPLGFIVQAFGFYLLCHSASIIILFLGCFIAGTSISLCMPKCMLAAAGEGNAATIAVSTAMILSSANIGTFATPFITNISTFVMKNDSTQSRFIFASTVALICGLILFIAFRIKNHITTVVPNN